MEEEKRFTARVIEKINNGKGYWESTLVGIFDGDKKIGGYKRNYPNYATSTFYAFELNDKWYALYSKDYTATRIMSLPDCQDIGGEEPNSLGFCPTEFYVPELCGQICEPDDPKPILANHDSKTWAFKIREENYERYYFPDDPRHPQPDEERKVAYLKEKERSQKENEEWYKRHPFITQFAKFGFVAGCVWGDDSGGWKLQFLDLSKADQGIVTRDERFGYLELPVGVKLADAVEVLDWGFYLNDPLEKINVRIAVPVTYNMLGKKLD